MKQSREENNNNGKKADKMHVKEWLHQNAKRPIKVKFGPDEAFYLLNRKGNELFYLDLAFLETKRIGTKSTGKGCVILKTK